MSAFGFDPNIILSGRTASLADMLEPVRQFQGMQQSQAMHQATLADLMRKQQQEQALQEVFRQNAGNPAAVGQALMQRGLGQQAMGWMGHQSEVEARQSQAQKIAAEIYEKARQELRNQVAVVKAPEQYEQLLAGVTPEQRAKLGLPAQYDPGALEAFVAGGIAADKQRQMTEDERHHREMEKRPTAGMMPMPVLVTGEGGIQQVIPDLRNLSKPVVTPTTADGKPIVKPQAADAKLAERNVGGWAFNPKNPPSADGAKKMASAVIAQEKILGALDRMEKLYSSKNPSAFLNPMSEDASLMEADWKEATDQVRIIGEMGVPNGADYVMLAKQIPNPVGLSGVSKSPAAIKAKFGTLRKQIEQTVGATAKAYKYFPEGSDGPKRSAAPAKGPPSAGMVRIRDIKSGRTGWADPGAVPEGAEVVNGG